MAVAKTFTSGSIQVSICVSFHVTRLCSTPISSATYLISGVSPPEIEWAIDLQAGKQLIGWLADQLDGDAEAGVEGPAIDRMRRAASKDIALEREVLSYVCPNYVDSEDSKQFVWVG